MRKIDVVLIHQPLETPRGLFHNVHPIGLFGMADFLQQQGFKCQILNLGVEKSLNPGFSIVDYIRDVQPAIIGIGLHWYIHLYNVLELAKELKTSVSSTIVLGGYTASIFSTDILRNFSFIDAIIDGEGEVPIVSMTRQILAKDYRPQEIPNLVFRNKKGDVERSISRYMASSEDLDGLNYSNIVTLKNYREYFRIAVSSPISTYYPLPKTADSVVLLSTGRGCANRCFNCGASTEALKATNFKPQVRYRKPKVVLEEIKKFISYGYRYFAIVYNPENDFSYYLNLFSLIRENSLNIGLIFDSWFLPPKEFIDSFANTFDLEYSAIGLTFESGSSRIRNNIGKIDSSNEDIISFLSYVRAKKIFTNTHFTIGMPQETIRDIKDTQTLMKKIRKLTGNIIVNTIPMEPGSVMANFPQQFNITVYRKTLKDYVEFTRDMAHLVYPEHPLGYATEKFSEEALQKMKLNVFLQCYMNWQYAQLFLKTNRDRKKINAKLFSWLGIVMRSPKLFYRYTPGALC